MVRILFYIHGLSGGGAERVLATLANSMAAQGHDVVIAYQTEETSVFQLDERIKCRNLYDGMGRGRRYNSLRLRRNIRRIAKSEEPDIIVVFMAALGCSVVVSTLGLGIPVIISEHTNVSRDLGWLLNVKRWLSYPLASAVTVLTRWDYRLWRKKHGNVVYMPNPIDLQPVSLEGKRKRVILTVGRVRQWHIKGFDNLLRCWAMLWRDFPEWELQIAGDYDTTAEQQLAALASEVGAKNYRLLGFCSNVKQLMAESEVFCLSSRVEGLPMALIEAMNAGCCCVSFDVVTGPREIIHNDYSGLIAKNQDIQDLASKLRMAMGNDAVRHELASKAPLSVKKYSTCRILDRWQILFEKVIERK